MLQNKTNYVEFNAKQETIFIMSMSILNMVKLYLINNKFRAVGTSEEGKKRMKLGSIGHFNQI